VPGRRAVSSSVSQLAVSWCLLLWRDASAIANGPRELHLGLGDKLRTGGAYPAVEREFYIDNLLVRIHFIIEMIWWTGLAPWEF